MTPIEASKLNNGKQVFSDLQDNKQRRKSQFHLGHLVRTADIKKTFWKGASTNWYCLSKTITENFYVTLRSNRINYIPLRDNENL